MKTKDAPSAEEVWEGMSEKERIEWLAVKVMGWHKVDKDWKDDGTTYCWMLEGNTMASVNWNPLVTWDDWRAVEDKIMQDKRGSDYSDYDCGRRFTSALGCYDSSDPFYGILKFQETDLPARCKAAFIALQ